MTLYQNVHSGNLASYVCVRRGRTAEETAVRRAVAHLRHGIEGRTLFSIRVKGAWRHWRRTGQLVWPKVTIVS